MKQWVIFSVNPGTTNRTTLAWRYTEEAAARCAKEFANRWPEVTYELHTP